ncbi:MAG: glucosaminidase domain-containing protein [Bacillota bacterium]|nr:glucosaminidase domain-containing protein [Bacillota bacterium]
MNTPEHPKTKNKKTTENKKTSAEDAAAAKKKLLSMEAIIAIALMATLSLGLFVGGTTANVISINSDAADAAQALVKEKSSSATEVDLANALRISTVDYVYEQEAIPAYSTAQIRQLDMSQPSGVTVSDLKLVTQGALVGLEDAFLKAEQDYGVNCLFVMAIASLESANGTICFRPNNMFGYGSTGFSSKAEGIDVVSKALAQRYLSPGGGLYSGKTISDVNKRYASSSTWDDKVATRMTGYYATISKHHNAALEKLR